MNRLFAYLSALVGIGGVLVLANQGTAQAPPSPKPGGKVAVFNVLKVVKDYGKFQSYVKMMTDKKQAATGPLSQMRVTILKLQDDIQKEPIQVKRDTMTQTLVAEQRKFEDQERQISAALDTESSQYLRVVYGEVQKCVEAVAQTNGYDLVFAYPDATDPKDLDNPLYFSAKFRVTAATPFYVSPQADMTEVLILTLNKNFPAPGAVQPAGATAPAGTPK